jgi:hypothetical protein
LADAREQIRDWQHDYNHFRPHSGLGNIPLVEFMAKEGLAMRAAQPRKSIREDFENSKESRAPGQLGHRFCANHKFEACSHAFTGSLRVLA